MSDANFEANRDFLNKKIEESLRSKKINLEIIQVENGWIVLDDPRIGYTSKKWVAQTLDELCSVISQVIIKEE